MVLIKLCLIFKTVKCEINRETNKFEWSLPCACFRELKGGVLKSINRCELCKEFHFFLRWDALSYTLKKASAMSYFGLSFAAMKNLIYSSTVRFYKPCILLWLFKFVFYCFYYPFLIGPKFFFCLNVHWNSSVSGGNFEILKLAFSLNQR